jgi:hypothetical protein
LVAKMTTTPKRTPERRWFRWSLRTTFVVVTEFGAWLGWEIRRIRVREAEAERLRDAGMLFDTEEMYQPNAPILDGRRIPWWRAALGDKTYVGFDVIPPNEDLSRRLERIFPEAMVVENGWPRPTAP